MIALLCGLALAAPFGPQALPAAALSDAQVSSLSTLAAGGSSARALLGLDSAGVQIQTVILPADVSNSSNATLQLATGMTFTPEASKTYLVVVYGAFTAAATTTGLQWVIADSGTSMDGSAALWLQTRGGTSTSSVVISQSAVATTAPSTLQALGTSASSTAGSTLTPFTGFAIWTADASPSPVGVYFTSEVNTSQVTLVGSKVVLMYRLLN